MICKRPSDFPQFFTVRPHYWVGGVDIPSPYACLCESLDEARGCVPEGMESIPLSPNDDPVIVEWYL